MKNLKLTLLALTSVFALTFTSCKKQDIQPEVTADGKGGGGGGGTAPAPAFIFNIPTFGISCESDAQYCFDASFTNKGLQAPGGHHNSIDATVLDATGTTTISGPQIISGNTGEFCFSGLLAGTYTVRVHFQHTPNENAAPVNATYSFVLTVQPAADCGVGTSLCPVDGINFTRSATAVETDVNFNAVNVNLTYVVTNCSSNDITGLKLQGGLVNKGSLIGIPTWNGLATNLNYSKKVTGGNTVLTWTFGLPAGAVETFNIVYNVWPTACGNPLTGQWSLKNNAGIPVGVAPADLSTTQTGYMNRLFWVCN